MQDWSISKLRMSSIIEAVVRAITKQLLPFVEAIVRRSAVDMGLGFTPKRSITGLQEDETE